MGGKVRRGGPFPEKWAGRSFPLDQVAPGPDQAIEAPVDKSAHVPVPMSDREHYSHHKVEKDYVNSIFGTYLLCF